MAQRTITTDDLTGRESAESTHYHVTVTDTPGTRSGGDKYEIDLSAASHDALVAFLTGKTAEFHGYMRKVVTDTAPAGKRARSTSPRNPAPASSETPDETKRARAWLKESGHTAPTVKEWGRDNGLSEYVKDGPGVMPSALVVAYAKAHGMPETAPEPPADSTATAPADSTAGSSD